MTDAEVARAQWLAQRKAMVNAQRRLTSKLRKATIATVDRWMISGAVTIPIEHQRDIAAEMARMWREAISIGGRFVIDGEKAAFTRLETKEAEMTFFEQLVLSFLNRFGAQKVVQVLDTTRKQIVAAIDRETRRGASITEIGKAIQRDAPAIAKARAFVIARTEVHTASVFAGQETAKSASSPMNKRWISVFDHRTRDFGEGDGIPDQANHRVMNEVTVGPDEVFSVPNSKGGHDLVAYPGDPNAPAYTTVNCRCALIYRRVGRPWPKSGD